MFSNRNSHQYYALNMDSKGELLITITWRRKLLS